MAHAILFTDRSPMSWTFKGVNSVTPLYSPSPGAYKIASVLRELGLKVLVINNCLSITLKGIKDIIDANSKDLLWVGISTTFLSNRVDKKLLSDYRGQWKSSSDRLISVENIAKISHSKLIITDSIWNNVEINEIASYVKQFNAPVLIGGAWVNILKEYANDNCFLIDGTAEEYVVKFTLDKLKNNNILPPKLVDNSEYDNIGFKKSRILYEHTDLITPETWLPIEVARGCAFNCAYCNYSRKSHFDAYKNPEVLRDELIRNYEKFGVTKFIIVDDLYNDSKEKVRVLYDKVWSKLPFKPEWSSYMRLDNIYGDRESAEIINASGAKLGSFGIETLNDRAGKNVGKGLGKARILETLQYLNETWKSDTLVHAFFLSGLPLEPRQSIEETIDWLKDTNLIDSYNFIPLWIQPDQNKHIHPLDQISSNNTKYGINWIEKDNWINTEGVTLKEADALAVKAMSNQHNFVVSFGSYADLRTAGFTHSDLVHRKTDLNFKNKLININDTINKKVIDRLNQVFDIRD
jgi:radical SAM superfamily enzyme YgiQ (UPF0313 family)